MRYNLIFGPAPHLLDPGAVPGGRLLPQQRVPLGLHAAELPRPGPRVAAPLVAVQPPRVAQQLLPVLVLQKPTIRIWEIGYRILGLHYGKMFSSHLTQDVWVSDDNEEGLGPGDGHVEPLGVCEEAESVLEVQVDELGVGSGGVSSAVGGW